MHELAAQIFVLRWVWAIAAPILSGAVLVIGLCVALAADGNWLPLAFLSAVVALVVGTIRRVSRRMQREQTLDELCADARAAQAHAAGFTFSDNGDRNSVRRGLRADSRARLAPR
jgi:membrane protein implicated in regulation of membrane protease activity